MKIGQTFDAMYIGFNSDTLAPNQITDYLLRVVQPKLQAVTGVQTAELLGQKVFSLRAWLDPQKLAAFGLTATDVSQALTANDYISGIGTTKGQMVRTRVKEIRETGRNAMGVKLMDLRGAEKLQAIAPVVSQTDE